MSYGEYLAAVALRVYMRSHLVAARQDMSWASADTVYRRFLGWPA
ncbi:hypothetical protein AB0C15_22015 [Micromonospora sp. NPDC048835]